MAIGAAATATATFAKAAVEGYAEYEQLVGGVETLFGESASAVQEYAANAYKTAGLSANEYMETVTSFSASLLQSLGGDTEAAAQYADMAISDMSDNANKMGTSMEAIQNAYNGFAKQNYTMLDNLKLGYGGTASEMQRLIMDAEALDASFSAARDENGDLAMSYSDIVDAIHIVQDNMGITGTTAREASATISGSLSAMRSAWANLTVGIANENANFDQLVSDFVESAVTVGENLIPRVEQALSGIGQLIVGLAPVIADALPVLISDVLPTLLQTAFQLVSSVGTAIIDNLPMLLESAIELVFTLADGIIEALPELIPAIISVILTITEKLTDPDTVLRLVQAAIQIIGALAMGLVNAIPQLVQSLPVIVWNIVQTLIQLAPTLISSGWEMIKQLAAGIWDAAGQVWDTIKSVASGILDSAKEALASAAEVGKNLVLGIWDGIKSLAGWLWDQVSAWVESIWDGILDFFGIASPSKQMKWVGSMLVEGLAGSIEDDGDEAVAAAEAMSNDINNVMNNLADGMGKTMRTDFEVRGSAKTSGAAGSAKSSEDEAPIPIIVQCVLDGQIVSENTTMWQRRMARATG